MATKPQFIPIEKAHFNNFRQYLPMFENACSDTVDYFLSLGILQVSTAFEHALANISGCTVVNQNSCDLSNGADAKLTTTRKHRNRVDATVHNITGKTGTLLVQVYEHITDKFYYFSIPYEAYKDLTYLDIQFTNRGLPNRLTKWFIYEVDDLEELAKSVETKPKANIAVESMNTFFSFE